MRGQIDRLRFQSACEKVRENHIRNGIGTLSEKTVHAVLKNYFETDSDAHEIPIGSFVADIVGENGIIEIQTGNFGRLRNKLSEFLKYSRVTVVYPVYTEKLLINYNIEERRITSKRRSPLRENEYTVFDELEYITEYLLHPNFTLCLVLMTVDEFRVPQSQAPVGQKKKRHKNAAAVYDRFPSELIDIITVEGMSDWHEFMPSELPEEFTTTDMVNGGMKRTDAGIVANVFRKAGIIEQIGKKGRSILYKKCNE